MYEVNEIIIEQNDGYTTKVTQYISGVEPKASLLILHGMAEHQERYQEFAGFLADNGVDVYTYNHRGHGIDQKIKDLGFFADKNGHQLVIDDTINVSKYVKKNNRGNKFFLLGHSMGSLIARNVIQTYNDYDGVIISGTSFPPLLVTRAGLFMGRLHVRMKGPKSISTFMNALMFGNKKYTALATRTAFDWLSRSHPVVGAYMNDPYCGFMCTASFYRDLLKLVLNSSRKSLIKKTDRNLALYIISGDHDPVGGYGVEIDKFISTLNKLQFNNIESKLYPECRHELLNELNKEEVYDDILNWISIQDELKS
ncbi:MAG TPA: alpha/beta hydrolase [Clostridiales bacterium]|nr:alpha/beta hydrolase [Clostridiales bacterium]